VSKEHKTGSTGSLHQKLGKEKAELDNVSLDVDEEQPEAELLDHVSYQELQKQLTEAEEKASQSWERMLRMQAETENTQRRVERDVANAHKFALEKFALELLPVVDTLERAVTTHSNDESGADTLLDGVSMTLKMLVKAMEKFGIESVDPEGKPFNPEQHQAVSMQANTTVPPNTVLSVLQKGYLLNKRLMRPAMVVVAK
jgi:molecular chaperone GrpE